MTFGALAFEAERSPMLAEAGGSGRIDPIGEIQILSLLPGPQRCQNSLRSERRFVQANSNGIVDRIRNCRNRGGQRSLAALFGPEGAFRINALDNDRLH